MFDKRRSEFQIIGEILDLSKDGAKKTEILYKSNMSFVQLRNYLSFMIEKNIIKEKLTNKDRELSKKIYVNTDKGNNLLEDINRLKLYFK